MPAEAKLRLDAVFQRSKAHLAQSVCFGDGKGLIGQVVEGRTSPQRQSGMKPVGSRFGVAGCHRMPRLAPQPLELREIELVLVDPDQIAGRLADDHLVWGTVDMPWFQVPPQLRNADL